jgi:hypothetical protein
MSRHLSVEDDIAQCLPFILPRRLSCTRFYLHMFEGATVPSDCNARWMAWRYGSGGLDYTLRMWVRLSCLGVILTTLPEGLVEGLASAPGKPRPKRENLRIDLTHNVQIHVVCKWAFV